MKDKGYYIFLFFILMALGFAAGNWFAKKRNPSPEIIEVIKTDTLTIRDTIRVDRPVYITQRVVDSIYVPVTDTLRLHDTAFVVLPRMQKEYRDSSYHAYVSGYDPALDSIEVFAKTQVVTVTVKEKEKPKKWGIGFQAGYGADKNGLTPYLGIGITYNLFSF